MKATYIMNKFKLIRPSFLFLFLFLLFIILSNSIPADKQKSPIVEVISAEPAPELTELFKPPKRGWLGADGATSVAISKDKILWLFGDTILGNKTDAGKRSGTIVRNTIGVQDLSEGYPGKVDFYWEIPGNIPTAYLLAEGFDQDFWYWPGSGAMVDGELFLFCYKIFPGTGPEAFAFEIGEMTLIQIPNPSDNPAKWKKIITPLGIGNNNQGFCSAVLTEKPYFYFLGFDDSPTERRAILARAKIDELKSGKGREALEFWTESSEGGEWSNKIENLLPLFVPGETETSLQYDSNSGRYITVFMKLFEPDIYIISAPKITGPWTDPIKVYTTPEPAKDKNYSAYASKAHPELARESNELIITYVVNANDFWGIFTDPNIYFPQFVRIKLKWKL